MNDKHTHTLCVFGGELNHFLRWFELKQNKKKPKEEKIFRCLEMWLETGAKQVQNGEKQNPKSRRETREGKGERERKGAYLI